MKAAFFLMFLLFSTAQSGLADQIHFSNGDRLTGKMLESGDQSIRILAEGIGQITIERGLIDKIVTDQELAEIAAKEADKKAKEESPWSGEISAGFDRKRGNTKETELYGEIEVKYKKGKNEVKSKARAFYSAQDRKMNAQQYYGLLRYDRRFGDAEKWFWFGSTEADRDRFANIEVRLTPNAGLGYWFFDRDDLKFKTEVGAGFEHTRFRDETEHTSEMVVIPKAYFEKTLFEKVKATQEITIYPNMTDTGEYRLVSESTLDTPITDSVGLKFKLIDHYNSNPGDDTKKNDLQIISSIAYKF